jgi:hypothetical protein
MEEFRLLPVRTGTGKVIQQKKFEELLKMGLSHEDAMNIILGKRKRSWADKMSYMSPVVYRGYGNRNVGIVSELKEPGKRNPKIRERIIYLTGSDHTLKDHIKTEETKVTGVVDLVRNQEINDVELFKDEDEVDTFDMDFINDIAPKIEFNKPEK